MPEFDRVTAIFHAAAARDPSERAALLDEQCGADAALRAEVESLLAADAAAGDFLEVPAAVAAGFVPEDQAPLSVGARVGPYVIEEELGRGGMSRVYLAEDERLERKVAVKALAPEFAPDRRRRERLRQEARAAAALSHPGIATVYALEEIDDRLYLVGEYVPGETLRPEIERGPGSPQAVVATGIQIAHALAAAHAAGVVHRDLKPENLIRDETGRVRILDFGVAHIAPAARQPGQRLTEAGLLIGTPGYMSPEQLEGAQVDGRADIFALGVVLYELASGRHPFEAGGILSMGPPGLRDVNPAAPPALERIIRRCLEKARVDRYASALDLANELESVRLGLDDSSRATADATATMAQTPSHAPVRWWTLHQVAAMTIAGLMVWPVVMVHGDTANDWTLALLLSVISSAALNGTLRAHLLFLAAFDIGALRVQLARSMPWLQRSDGLFAVLLLLAAVPTARSHVVRSAVLAAVGVGWAVTSLVIEPATERAAFPHSNTP